MDAVAIRHRRYDVDAYYALAASGVISPDDRVELIEGEIIPMSPIGVHHAFAVRHVARRMALLDIHERAVLSVQSPLRLDAWSEPEPDIVVLVPRVDDYRHAHPGPGDALLVIEVADTTIRYDRGRKLPLYARSGIPEVWIVDLRKSRIEVYREPQGGAYAVKTVLGRGASLSPAAFPDVSLTVDEIIGPPDSPSG